MLRRAQALRPAGVAAQGQRGRGAAQGVCVSRARRAYATEKAGDKAAFDAKRQQKSRSKTDAAGVAEYQRLAKLVKPEQFKVPRSAEEVAYATQLARIFNRNHQAEAWRLNRALHRAVRCRQAAIAALPTEQLRAAAAVLDDEWYAEQLAGPNRFLTATPPLPGYAALMPDEEELIKESEANAEENEQQN